jgi:hypothetical protein
MKFEIFSQQHKTESLEFHPIHFAINKKTENITNYLKFSHANFFKMSLFVQANLNFIIHDQ